MPTPPNYAAERTERLVRERLTDMLGEDAENVTVAVDEYTGSVILTRVSDEDHVALGDESDEADPDYWAAVPDVPEDEEPRVTVEGPLDTVIESLRGWIKGEVR